MQPLGCTALAVSARLCLAIPSEPYLPRPAGQGVNISEIGINI